jgi:hypothetical protein
MIWATVKSGGWRETPEERALMRIPGLIKPSGVRYKSIPYHFWRLFYKHEETDN